MIGRDASERMGRGAVALLVALGVIAAILAWRDAIRPAIIPKRFGEVAPGRVYRAGRLSPAAMSSVVRQHDIKTVVDLGADPEGSPADLRAQRTADALGVTRVRLDLVGDATGEPDHYVRALRLMTDPALQPVLVHCGAGTERTGCLVVLYRHAVEGVPLDAAFAEARRAGHDPARNPRLREVLERWGPRIIRAYRDGGSVHDAAGS